ncbi:MULTISPECIES: ParB/RepB/Spo0J family partition protein [unclassified Clostridium]|uniref:ParB/RepB/Spo0J family partition protein n=1 Tax=unclassified Clostridium TaxID=2614128 RepID=UPI0025BE6C08|nr:MULTISPECIES: ParB/RepB/Spo0J family partition protein [unclassified Clostridium]
MVKKSALGKGLSALIPENIEEEVFDEKAITTISMNLIRADKEQPRKNFDPDKILELSESIKQHGVIQPIILRKENDTYVIVAGERRWRAAKTLGLKEIPSIVMDLTSKEVVEISLIENIVREDLNPIEEALAYKRLIKEYNLTQEEISKKISKSRSAIANCMRLLNLDNRVQQYIIEGVISEGHGRAILAIEDKNLQYEISQKVIDEELNVRQTEKYIKNYSMEKKKRVGKNLNPYYKDLESKLENYFDTKVSLNSKNKNKGKIEIEYYSEEDLQRILDLLKL